MTTPAALDDVLVSRSLAGDRGAFGEIVARYQSLVCSIAYSATGSISQSEDLAQESFIDAWRQLRQLREPSRLRAWLCGIARNHALNALRRSGREPVREADPIEVVHEAPAPEPAPVEQAISEEEQAILWRSLERIPETYREPLVLFYREQHSIEAVAAALDLSEDAVKQRLSRGRKLLQDQVQAFVEGALRRSVPGTAFTLGVLAALPSYSTSAAAATVAATATKGSALAKSATLVAVVNALIGPLVGFIGSYFGARAGFDAARTSREHAMTVRQTWMFGIGSVLYSLALVGFILAAPRWIAHAETYAALGIAIPVGFALWLAWMLVRTTGEARRLRSAERGRAPEAFVDADAPPRRARAEYRSRLALFGLPLVHIRYDTPDDGAGWARGWIAVGDRAMGVLFAMGAISIGTVSIGGAAVGALAVGGVAAGPLAFGGVAFGGLALGGAALGLFAIGGFAVAWFGAGGGLAFAQGYAGGGLAIGAHANDAAAQAYLSQHLPEPMVQMLFLIMIVLSVVPAAAYAWRARKVLRSP